MDPAATLLITGANRGIGLAWTRHALAAGEQVFATSRDPGCAALQRLKQQYPQQLELLTLDVTDEAARQELPRLTRGLAIDRLLLVAGVYGPDHQDFGGTDLAAGETLWQVNVLAPLRLAEILLPQVEISRCRQIVALSSLMGSMTDNRSGGAYLYRASKAALNAIMHSMAIDLAPRGVFALALHPGWVQTDMGGPRAPVDVDSSVSGMRAVLERAEPAHRGMLVDYQGHILPW